MGSHGEVKAASEKARIARAAGLVSAMTLVSRVLGLVREVVFAALIGAGYHADAFKIGFRIPNLLRSEMFGITFPRRSMTPLMYSADLGSTVILGTLRISWTFRMSMPYSSRPTLKQTT
jgi:hypothetical protein